MTTGPTGLEQCVVIAGGLGTRLGDRTAQIPKPLLPVAGRPFLDHLLDDAERKGIRHLIVLAGHLGHLMLDWANRHTGRIHIDCIVETEPAGTAGALQSVRSLLQPSFLCMNGDSFFDVNLAGECMAQSDQSWLAMMALRQVDNVAQYGEVILQDGVVSRFAEKGGRTGPGVINGGVYVFRKEILDFVPPPPSSLERDVFPRLSERGLLRGKIFDGYFIDIGTPGDYDRAQTELKRPNRHQP